VSQTLFLIVAVFGLLAALGTVLARNLIHAGLYLVAFFFVVACLFVMLEAEFLAAIQVLVYIGAVAILLMFGIMLTRNVQGDVTTSVPRGWALPAILATMGLFFVLAFGINNHVGFRGKSVWAVARPSLRGTPRAEAVDAMGQVVGVELLTRYAVPFEVAGLLLTAALVGAIALAHRETENDAPTLRSARIGRAAGPGGHGNSNSNGNGDSYAGVSIGVADAAPPPVQNDGL
jgi:NADH-quinone oxidoreductase subunit J